MFKRFFTFMTITIIICVMVASASLMLFLFDFWKNDRLTRLSDDALSLSRSVLTIYEEHSGAEIFTKNRELLNAALTASSDRSGAEMMLVSENGQVVYCAEYANTDADAENTTFVCPVHAGFRFGDELLGEARAAYPNAYTDQTRFSFRDEDVFVSAAELKTDDGGVYYVLAMQEVSTAYLPYTNEFVHMFIRVGLLGVFMAFIGSLITSYRMVSPLKKMTAAAQQYAQGDFSERINARDTYSELAEFADSFNSMAESLERIEESRSMFVANTSHELKTPMTIISGFIDGILDGTIPPEEEERYLRIVSEETKRLSSLVVAMLNISKIEAGKLELSLAQVNLMKLACKIVVGFEQAVEEKHLGVQGLDSLENVTVLADETLLSQVLFNLVDNAIKFTPENGVISVRLQQEGRTAVFRIRNTGKGIPEEELNLIFDRFYKVDKSRGSDTRSFGLGLYIVKSITELHRGTIEVQSKENEFTEFTVRLPLDPTERDN